MTAQHTRVVLLNADVTRDGEGDAGQAATTKMALLPCDGRRRGGCRGEAVGKVVVEVEGRICRARSGILCMVVGCLTYFVGKSWEVTGKFLGSS